MSGRKNRAWRVLLVVIALLVAFRLALPYLITRYVNYQLSDGPIKGRVVGSHVSILDGSFELDTIRLYNPGSTGLPLLQIAKTTVTLDWSSMLDGVFGGYVTMHEPTLNIDPVTRDSVFLTDIISQVKQVSPINPNRVKIKNGKIISTSNASSRSNVLLHNVQIDALNLLLHTKEEMSGRIYVQALSIGSGQLNAAAKINARKEIPDARIELRWENVNVKLLSEIFGENDAPRANSGELNLYSEIIVANGIVSGYIKPVVKDLNISSIHKQDTIENTIKWNQLIALLQTSFQDYKRKKTYASFPVEGEIGKDDRYWSSLWKIFSNPIVDKTELYTASSTSEKPSRVLPTPAEDSMEEKEKSKREIRKEKRKQRREERRKNKRS